MDYHRWRGTWDYWAEDRWQESWPAWKRRPFYSHRVKGGGDSIGKGYPTPVTDSRRRRLAKKAKRSKK